MTHLAGRTVAVLKNNEITNIGKHVEYLTTSDHYLNAGMYYLNLKSANFSQTVKILVVK